MNENWNEDNEKRFIRELNSLEEVENEIKKTKKEWQNYKKVTYWLVLTTLVVCLIAPYLAGNPSTRPLILSIGYLKKVVLLILISSGVIVHSFYKYKRKNEDKLSELHFRKRMLEKRK